MQRLGTSCTLKFLLLNSGVLPPSLSPSPYPFLASCHPQDFSVQRVQVRSGVCISVFPGSAALTVIPHSWFGLLQSFSGCLLLPPSRGWVQLPSWGRLNRAARVHASARLLGLQPSAAEEGWGAEEASCPRVPSAFFPSISQVSEGSEGALVPLRVGMETMLPPLVLLACVFCVLCADPGTGSARFLPEASVPTWREHNRGVGDP